AYQPRSEVTMVSSRSRRPPAGARFEELTPWTHDPTLDVRMLGSIHDVQSNSYCLDVGGGTGKIALMGSRLRPDLNWISVDVVAPSALHGQPGRVAGVYGDGSTLPFRPRSVSWLAFRSSLHYIGLNAALREARRISLETSKLIVLAKVSDQFETCSAWHLRMHQARSIVQRELYRSGDLVAAIGSSGYRVCAAELFYQWTSYDLTTWISRGHELDSGSQKELRAVIRECDDMRAVDGVQPLYVRGGRLHSRLQWCLIEASRREPGKFRTNHSISDDRKG
ncbi:MAG: hypothetical protein ACRD6W_13145, partial [Nitrososphaerales archaeon]